MYKFKKDNKKPGKNKKSKETSSQGAPEARIDSQKVQKTSEDLIAAGGRHSDLSSSQEVARKHDKERNHKRGYGTY